jgi:hypothetical protein
VNLWFKATNNTSSSIPWKYEEEDAYPWIIVMAASYLMNFSAIDYIVFTSLWVWLDKWTEEFFIFQHILQENCCYFLIMLAVKYSLTFITEHSLINNTPATILLVSSLAFCYSVTLIIFSLIYLYCIYEIWYIPKTLRWTTYDLTGFVDIWHS